MKRLGVAVSAALLAALALGQGPGEIRATSAPYLFAPVIVAQTTTVPVSVVVRDRNGRVIRGLKQSQFRLLDNGRPQAITSFQVETGPGAKGGSAAAPVAAGTARAVPREPAAPATAPKPRYVALLFDDVNSNRNDLMEARIAALRFMHEELGPGDRMAVFTISGMQSLGFSRDRAALAKTIAEIAPHPRASGMETGECPRMTPYDAYLIAELHDSGTESAMTSEQDACAGKNKAAVNNAPGGALSTCGLNCTFGRPPMMGGNSNGMPIDAMADAIWDMTRDASQNTLQVVRNVVDFTGKQPGQRIVVLASSGFFSETLGDRKEQIVGDALRAGVVINALDAKGLYTQAADPVAQEEIVPLPLPTLVFEQAEQFPMREAQVDAMASFAAATGGLFFQNNNDLTLGFEWVGLAPSLSYELAFTPTPLVRDGKLHQLKVSLAPPIPGAIIEARRGYYAPAPGLSAQEAEQELYQAMAGTATTSELPVTVATKAAAGELQVQVQLGVKEPKQKITMVAALFDAKGNFVMGRRSEVDLALKNATFQRLSKTGLTPRFALKTQPGAYRLRVVVLDEANGAATEINRQVRLK
jgi:VWFA-related protein